MQPKELELGGAATFYKMSVSNFYSQYCEADDEASSSMSSCNTTWQEVDRGYGAISKEAAMLLSMKDARDDAYETLLVTCDQLRTANHILNLRVLRLSSQLERIKRILKN